MPYGKKRRPESHPALAFALAIRIVNPFHRESATPLPMSFSLRFRQVIPCALLTLGLASCSTIKRYTPSIPLPKLPDITQVKRILPGSEDKLNNQDPTVPFDPRGELRPGHTLRVQVYQGLRSAKSMWNGLVMVELDGTISFKDLGSTKVRGMKVPEATRAIAMTFRVGGRTASNVVVHILSIENTSLIALDGDLAAGPQSIPLYDGITVSQAIRLSGGRSKNSSANGIYLTRKGVKRYFRSVVAAESNIKLEAGDIITLSPLH